MASLNPKNIGRNDPCHCDSGKKYKKCHLEKDEAKEREALAKAAKEAPVASAEAKPGRPEPSQKPGGGFSKFFNRLGFRKASQTRRTGGG